MPKVSVIMAVYNTNEEWLKEAIESILNQTYTDFEFIIINDGSTNNSEDVILSYKDERIVYIKQENQGLAKSLNNGLAIAKGEYIARMDSDDISVPERFQKQTDFLDTYKDISVLGSWFELFPETRIIKNIARPMYLDILKNCYIGHPTVMFRRLDFEKYDLKYNPEYKCEDYELWSRAIRYLKFDNIQEVLLKYRWHENNLSKPSESFMIWDKKVKQNMLDWLTDDNALKDRIYKAVFYNPQINNQNISSEKYSFFERIFSIKNKDIYKVITILGIKIKFKSKKLINKTLENNK